MSGEDGARVGGVAGDRWPAVASGRGLLDLCPPEVLYYEREKEGGFVPALRQQNAGERRYQGVRADLTEEMHKFQVTNVRGGFVEQECIDLFGKSPFEVAPEGFALLERIGALTRIHGRILMPTGRLLDALVLRPFFYSPAMLERAMEVWGKEYDPNEHYLTQLGYMVPAAD